MSVVPEEDESNCHSPKNPTKLTFMFKQIKKKSNASEQTKSQTTAGVRAHKSEIKTSHLTEFGHN